MPTRRRMKASQLGDSWVVSDEDYEGDESPEEDVQKSLPREDLQNQLRSRKPRGESQRSSTIPEPDLIMPSLHGDMNGSRLGTKPESNQFKKQNSKPSSRSEKAKVRPLQSDAGIRTRDSRLPFVTNEGQSNMDYFVAIFGHIAEWLVDVIARALNTLKVPISWIVVAYLLVGILTLGQNLLTNSVYSALSPICRIPGSSFLNLPWCQSPYEGPQITSGKSHVEFDQLMTIQSQFEDILDESAKGVSLPFDMKKTETSMRDLRQLVRYSQLQSRNELVLEFDGFIETARIAANDLQKFNSHVGRGVDMVLSTARWTQRVLDDMALKETDRGVIQSWLQDTLLAPFQPLQFTESRLVDQYIKHSRIISDEIERLIEEAQAVLYVLQNLEDRLETIHGIALRDNDHIQGSKDEVLAQLWSWVGGNRKKVKKFNEQLLLLRNMGQYRKAAWTHISGTIVQLQAMSAELQQLRESVGSAEVLKDRPDIPLAVHIETIRSGVERLEAGRASARQLENQHVRRILDGQDNEMRLVEG